MLYLNTQTYEWNTLLIFRAKPDMKQILSFLLNRRNSAKRAGLPTEQELFQQTGTTSQMVRWEDNTVENTVKIISS